MAVSNSNPWNGDEDLMKQFIPVPEDTLEDPICPCCHVEYRQPGSEGEEAERPLKTLCGHVFGNICLERWLPNNSCPMCRRTLSDSIPVHDDMIDLGDEVLSRVQIFGPPAQVNPEVGQIDPESAVTAPSPNSNSGTTHSPGQNDNELHDFMQSLGPELVPEVGNFETYRSWMLIQQLQTQRPFLPPHEQTYLESGGIPTLAHHWALFQEMQRRGAFNYPGMRQAFEDISDVQMYQELRLQGAWWAFDGTWTVGDGTVLWSSTGDGLHQRG